MRQLRISKQPAAPYQATDYAQTQSILQYLSAANPLPLEAQTQEQLLRYLVAVARQYQGRSTAWERLLAAGCAGAVRCFQYSPDPQRWLAWWVRQGIVKAA